MSTGESYRDGRRKGFKIGYEQGKFDAIAELGYLSVEDLKRDLNLGKLWEKYQDIFYQIKALLEEKELEK